MVGKGGTAGFLGRAYDPYTLYPDGDDMDMAKMDKVRVDDLKLPADVFASRLERPFSFRNSPYGTPVRRFRVSTSQAVLLTLTSLGPRRMSSICNSDMKRLP